MHSAIKNSQMLDESLNLNIEEGVVRRGHSVFNRKLNNSQADKTSTNRPVVPNYEHMKNVSMKKMKSQKEVDSEKESFNR